MTTTKVNALIKVNEKTDYDGVFKVKLAFIRISD